MKSVSNRRDKRYRIVYNNTKEVAPRTLEVLKPLFDNNVLLKVGDEFPTLKEALTRVDEYNEVHCRMSTTNRKGFFFRYSLLHIGCPNEACTYSVRLGAYGKAMRIRCTELNPHSCIAMDDENYTGRIQCQYSSKQLAAVEEIRTTLSVDDMPEARRLLLKYTKTPTTRVRVLNIIKEMDEGEETTLTNDIPPIEDLEDEGVYDDGDEAKTNDNAEEAKTNDEANPEPEIALSYIIVPSAQRKRLRREVLDTPEFQHAQRRERRRRRRI